MPAAVAISDILRFVAACAMAHPAVRDVPDYVSMPFEVVSHARTESYLFPFSVGVNADPARGLLHDSRSFATVDEAVAFTGEKMAAGRSVDVGLMGVNLRAHPDAFRSLAEAFDPQSNICAGAIILAEAYREVRQARCIYNSGRPDCRSPTGTNGYPEAVSRSARALLSEAEVMGTATPLPPRPVSRPTGTAFQRVLDAPPMLVRDTQTSPPTLALKE